MIQDLFLVATQKKERKKEGPNSTKYTCEESFFSRSISTKAPSNRHIPWPQSPNITAKRNGNVTTEYTAGLASWYRATLQQKKSQSIQCGR